MINTCKQCKKFEYKSDELEDSTKRTNKNCVEITVISKETGRKINGLLCKTQQGLKFHTKPIPLERKHK